MPYTDCPECGYELATASGSETADGEAVHVFSCPECGHEWTDPIL